MKKIVIAATAALLAFGATSVASAQEQEVRLTEAFYAGGWIDFFNAPGSTYQPYNEQYNLLLAGQIGILVPIVGSTVIKVYTNYEAWLRCGDGVVTARPTEWVEFISPACPATT